MTENQLQKIIIKFLKDGGCYVIKTKPQPGTPVGCPDIIALNPRMGSWAVVEVKSSDKAPFRPGQEATLDFLRRGCKFVYAANPQNWPAIRQELTDEFL